jgi:hypothetical protein
LLVRCTGPGITRLYWSAAVGRVSLACTGPLQWAGIARLCWSAAVGRVSLDCAGPLHWARYR